MTVSRSRRLAGSLAILWVLMQPLLSSNALVGVLSLFHSHGHDVSVLADSGHLDVVLSHATSEASEGEHVAERHLHAAAVSQAAHVVHLTSTDVARDSLRRGAVDARAASLALPLPANPPAAGSAPRSVDRLAHAPSPPRKIVLRI